MCTGPCACVHVEGIGQGEVVGVCVHKSMGMCSCGGYKTRRSCWCVRVCTVPCACVHVEVIGQGEVVDVFMWRL